LTEIIHFILPCVVWCCGVRKKRLGDLIRVIEQNGPKNERMIEKNGWQLHEFAGE